MVLVTRKNCVVIPLLRCTLWRTQRARARTSAATAVALRDQGNAFSSVMKKNMGGEAGVKAASFGGLRRVKKNGPSDAQKLFRKFEQHLRHMFCFEHVFQKCIISSVVARQVYLNTCVYIYIYVYINIYISLFIYSEQFDRV